MGCCLPTQFAVDEVIGKFAEKYAPLAKLTSVPFPQLIAGRMVNVGPTLIAPISGRKCMFYSVKAEELIISRQMVDDGNGGLREEVNETLIYRYTDTRSVDFLLVDPGNPTVYIYIPFSQTPHKIHSETDARSTRIPAGGQVSDCIMDMRSRYAFDQTTEWLYSEQCFEYGEEAAVVGIVKDASVAGGKMLGPLSTDMLTDQYFTDNNWSFFSKGKLAHINLASLYYCD